MGGRGIKKGFADLEYVMPLSILAILIVLCLPALQLSFWLFIVLVVPATLLVLVPWFIMERRGRRHLKELMEKGDRLDGHR